MINNYDSVVSCSSSGATHSQKQESTSYTATKRTWLSFVTVLVTLFCFSFVQGQIGVTVTGNSNTTPALSASYSTLAAALTDLNAVTAMSGPVVLTLDSGTSETAPIKGFVLGSATLNPVLSATNTITINKSGAGAVTINAGIGTSNGPLATPDGMFYLNGADYVTIDGVTFTDGNSTNATVAMEFGLAMFKRTAGDGCNNNTVQNCIFNMQRVNTVSATGTGNPMADGAVGILVVNSIATAATTALIPTNGGTLDTNGTNSNNKFYTNTINGGNGGIAMFGFTATTGIGPAPTSTTFLGDLGNDVGGSSNATGNTILNFGGGVTPIAVAGVRLNNQWSVNISYNTINNNNGSGVNNGSTLRGIFSQTSASANITINNNNITVSSGATTSQLCAVENTGGNETTFNNVININSNTIVTNYSTATSGATFSILNSATPGNLNINNNIITLNTAAASGNIYSISNTGAILTTLNINGNTIAATLSAATTSASVRGVSCSGGSVTCATSISNNNFNSFNFTGATGGTGDISVILQSGTPLSSTISNNIFNNLSVKNTGAIYLISNNYTSPAGGFKTIQNNIVQTGFNRTIVASGSSKHFYGYYDFGSSPTGVMHTISGNNFSNITTNITGSGRFAGIYSNDNSSSNPGLNCYNNTISNITHGGTGYCYGVYLDGFSGSSTSPNEVYGNTVSGITSTSTSTSHGGIVIGSLSLYLNVYNNTVQNNAINGVGSQFVGISNGGTSNLNKIYNNTIINNTSTTTSSIVGVLVSGGSQVDVYQNKINTFSSAGNVWGVYVVGGTLINVYDHKTIGSNNYSVFGLSSSGLTSVVEGIRAAGGTTINFYKNNVYGLSNSSASSTATSSLVNGISITSGTTVNSYNNLIGDLTAPAANLVDAIRGINIPSATSTTRNIYNNSIYLNASSTGTNFGTSGIYHVGVTSPTTSALNLQNNIIVNNSTAAGTGYTVAFRKDQPVFTNNVAASNKNLFFAGGTYANKAIGGFIASGVTTPYTTMVDFQTAATPTEANSFTEASFDPATFFVSTTGSNANFLQPAAGITTQAEGGGNTIALTSPDYNGITRPGGTGTTFDVGAWEFEGISPAPVLTTLVAAPALTAQCTKADRAISINVTTSSGTISSVTLNYIHNGTAQTPVTMTNSSGNTYTGTMIAPATGNATVTWSITAINSIGLTTVYNGTSYADEPTTGISATATASVNSVCSGSPTNLSMSVAGPGSITLGLGSLTSSSAPTSPFNGGYGGMKGQYLIKASELTAAGLSAGNISSMSFFVSVVGTTYNDFTMQIGNTTLTQMPATADIQGGLTTVKNSYNITPVINENNIVFDTPFNWDGSSNIIVSTCWSNNNTSNTSTIIKYDNTSFPSSQSLRRDSVTANNIFNSTGTIGSGSFTSASSTRPQFKFTGTVIQTPTAYSWSDGTTTVGTTNPLVVNPTAATTYTGNATVAGCPVSASTSVTILALPTAPTVAANPGQCGAGVPTLTMADPNSFTTPIFKWYDAATAGTVLQASTSTTYTTAISATTTFYVSVVNPTTGCESARTVVTAAVSTADAIAISGAPTASVCLGQNFALTPTQTGTNNTFALTWSASTAGSGLEATASGTLGTALTVTPTAAGTYTYSINGSEASTGCTGTATTASITVVNPNAGITATASATPNPVCSGSPTSLSVSLSNAAPAVYNAPSVSSPTSDEDLGNITITQGATTILNNTSTRNSLTGTIGVATGTAGSFSNYTAFGPYALTAGQTYNFSLSSLQTPSDPYSNSMAIYIDYNRDGDFADTNEAVYLPTATTGIGAHTVTGTFTIPSTALNGLTRMRVICNEGTITGPTMAISWGEFEEYMLNISSTTNGGGAAFSAPTAYAWSDGSTTVGTTNPLVVNPTAATTYTVNATVNGCPLTASTLVNINPLPTAPSVTASTQCGTLIPTASVADPNSFTTPTFKWYATATSTTPLQTSVSTTYTTAISATTTFHVSVVNPTTGCESARTPVTVTVIAPDPISATTSSAAICLGSSVTLTAANTASTPAQTYTYSWLSTPNSGVTTAQTGATISVTPDAVGSYTYTVSASGGGCQTSNTVLVTVNAVPNIETYTASASVACAGSTINLAATATDVLAGASTASGIGTSYTSSTGYPTFFGSYYYQDWSQMVYTASELQAMGLAQGDITSITFNIGAIPSPATVNGYSIRLGATANNTLAAFQTTGLTTVYGPVNYTVSAAGDITLNFTTPYNWDGSSNIIVDVRGTGGFGSANATTQYTTTTGNSVVFANTTFSSDPNFWTSNPTPTTSTSRPNIKFGGQILTNTSANYAWTWSDGVTTVLTAATGSVTLPASASTTYTATATNSTTGCASSSLPITVTANPLPTAPTATNSVQCGTLVPTASVSDTNTFASAAIYNWYATTTSATPLQSSTSTTYITAINTTTTFHVAVVNPTTGCESARTPVTVTVNVPDLISATANDTTICLGQSVTITTANLSSIPTQNYTYSWVSTTGSGLAVGQTATSFTVTPTTEGSYTYTVTGVDGTCQTTASVTVLVSPLPVVTLDVPSTVLACAGSTVNLGASVNAISAGTTTSSGTGTSYTSSSGYPTFFGNYWNEDWSQMVYTASELQAMGLNPGDITSITFNIGDLPDPATVNGYSIRLGATTNNTLSAFQTTGLTTVFGPVNYTVAATGDVTINFTTPYNWDGSSNIIIDVRGTGQFGSANATTQYTTTTGNTVLSTAATFTANPNLWTSNPTPTTSTSRPNVRFGGQVLSNENANYAWTWSDGTSNVLTAASGTVTLPTGTATTYTATATHLVSGCSNELNSAQVVATVVSTTAPVGVNTIAPSGICFGESVNLSLSYTGSTVGLVFQWQSSVNNGISWQDVATATSATLITTQTVPTQYRCKMISCGGNAGYSTIASVGFTNTIMGTSAATRCGTGTVTINAIASAGAVVNWYANATGGPSLGSGISFTTPIIASTTTYYATAESSASGLVQFGSGTTTSGLSLSAFNNYRASAKYQMIYSASELTTMGLRAGSINSIAYFVTSLGDAATNANYTVKLGTTSQSSFANTTFTTPAFTTCYGPSTYTHTASGWQTINFSTPYVWDGVSNIIIEVSHDGADLFGSADTQYTATTDDTVLYTYNGSNSNNTLSKNRFNVLFSGQVACFSPRVPVTVTVTPAPAITFSSASASICTGSATAAITATGTSNYNTYVWSPATGVSGNSTTGWIFNPTATTTYTLTASQSSGSQCITTATFTVNVNAVPSDITITPANPSACVGVVLPLTATGGVFSNAMLSQSMDVLPANFISSANATITNNTTYFAQGTGSVLFTVPTSASDWLALNQNVNLVGASSATLTFSHIAAMEGSSTSYDYGYVEYSTDGGTTWITFTPANYSGTASTAVFNTNARFSTKSYADWISTFSGSTSTPGTGPATSLWKTETFNIPAAALTSSQFRIRFRYTTDSSLNYYGWLIDDVKIVKSQSNITWSPVTNLYTNAAGTTPYTAGTNASTVYVLPTTVDPLTFVATSTNGTTNCSKTASITLRDAVAPVVVTQPVTIQLNAAGTATLTAAQVNNGSSDNCSIATMTVSPNTFTCANVGTNIVTLTVTDASGNVDTGTATVTVSDQVGPTVVTQPVTVQLNAAGTASITAAQVNNGSSDACGIASLSVSPNTFTCANLGANTVTLTVTDVNGIISTGTAVVTVTIDFTTALDNDLDGSPDNCDTDDDNDGVLDTNDNCQFQANSNQADNDADGLGDACDDDDDNDGVLDGYDNCPFTYNPGQEDIDNDGMGDICDTVEINVSEAITPDGDGINDTWFINNIQNYPNNSVKVYNRWGDLIFSKRNYQNDWNGSYANNGNNIPDASSYYYQIDLDGNGSIDYDGWIYITK